MEKIKPSIESFQKTKNELVAKYGEAVEDGKGYRIKPNSESWKKFEAEMNKLLDQKIDLKIEQIRIDDLKGIHVTPRDLDLLNWLIV